MFVLLTSILRSQETPKIADAQRPCNDFMSQAELNECAGALYRKADERLNVIYRRALEFLQQDLSESGAIKDSKLQKRTQAAIRKLKAAERAWIRYRDLHCEAARHQYEGGTMSPMIWSYCMEETTMDRIAELKTAYEIADRTLE